MELYIGLLEYYNRCLEHTLGDDLDMQGTELITWYANESRILLRHYRSRLSETKDKELTEQKVRPVIENALQKTTLESIDLQLAKVEQQMIEITRRYKQECKPWALDEDGDFLMPNESTRIT